MSEVDIVSGFDTFVDTLRASGFGRSPEGSWSAEQVAAHHQQMHDEQLPGLRS